MNKNFPIYSYFINWVNKNFPKLLPILLISKSLNYNFTFFRLYIIILIDGFQFISRSIFPP